MTKDPWLFWGGGVEVEEESLASLGFALYGLVEKPGDIVQVGT